MHTIDNENLTRLIETAVIATVAIALFFGLRGRIALFARWANLPRLALTPVRLMLRYAVLVLAAILILELWGFKIDTLLAVLGTLLGLVAIGFVAMWSVLSNFLCTFVLIVFKPFSVGDEIELPGNAIRGRVVDLSLIFTTLQVDRNQTVLVPNNTFFQGIFKRHAGTVTVDLDYQLRQDQPHGGGGGT
jgi:small-conductance mechanosensitive channel